MLFKYTFVFSVFTGNSVKLCHYLRKSNVAFSFHTDSRVVLVGLLLVKIQSNWTLTRLSNSHLSLSGLELKLQKILYSSMEAKKNERDVIASTKEPTIDGDKIALQEDLKKPDDGTLQMSKRAQKKLLRKEQLKEQRKAKRALNLTQNSNPGFNIELFQETDYYFENGLRKVYPYPFTFSTYAKERWYGRCIQDIFENEFRVDSPDNFRKSVEKGKMKVNGTVVGLDYVLKNGDLIEHQIHRHENPVSGDQVEIIEDTPELVVVNKPSSIPCHPCGKFRFNSIVFIMGKEFGYANLRNIYRLDRLTSGVLMMGKTAKKTKELENQVLHRRVQKEYMARVMGEFPQHEITVDKPLACLSHKITLWQVKAGGKPSRTTFQRISYNGKTSVVKCMPHTGRTHQIRVHLQYLGHPIVNDPFYNSPAWGKLRGKGGHCDISHEELCQRIMQEHNVGMWCEGENQLLLSRDDTTSSSDTLAMCSQQTSDNSPAAFPLSKRLKLSKEEDSQKDEQQIGSIEELGSVAFPSEKKQSTTLDSSSSSETVNSISHSELSEHSKSDNENKGVGHNLAQDSCLSSELKKNSEKTYADKNGHEDNQASTKKLQRKGFDPDRLQVDPMCESCHLKYIDPKPSDLLLYLHASRYKGPTWEYSAKLPDWAKDDWEEPPEYQKYFHS